MEKTVKDYVQERNDKIRRGNLMICLYFFAILLIAFLVLLQYIQTHKPKDNEYNKHTTENTLFKGISFVYSKEL